MLKFEEMENTIWIITMVLVSIPACTNDVLLKCDMCKPKLMAFPKFPQNLSFDIRVSGPPARPHVPLLKTLVLHDRH